MRRYIGVALLAAIAVVGMTRVTPEEWQASRMVWAIGAGLVIAIAVALLAAPPFGERP